MANSLLQLAKKPDSYLGNEMFDKIVSFKRYKSQFVFEPEKIHFSS